MLTIILAIRLFAASQVLLFAMVFSMSENPIRVRASGLALALAAICYLLLPTVQYSASEALFYCMVLFAQLIPVFLFIFVWEMFEDDRTLPFGIWLLAGVYLGLSFWAGWLWLAFDAKLPLLQIIVQLAKLVWALGAIFVIWHGRIYDLVEARLKLRRILITSLGMLVSAIIAAEIVAGEQVPEIVELIGMLAIFVVVTLINLVFMKLNPAFVFVAPVPAASRYSDIPTSQDSAAPTSFEASLIDNLEKLMQNARIYADHDLRISDVAVTLHVPEYKLRRLINEKMAYRNFNQYINRYRIDEASKRLVTEQHLPILTIALDVGFRSISSFNDAFRARHGCPPSVYRSTIQPDNAID